MWAFIDELKVDEHGMVRSPGKFEGEPSFVPELWDQDGEDETVIDPDTEQETRVFYITFDDAERLGHGLKAGNTVWLTEDDQGFVNSVVR